MNRKIYAFVVFLAAVMCLGNPAFAKSHHGKPHHKTGKHLSGGHGSSHKGGHYIKP
jgi:hypothetical protein